MKLKKSSASPLYRQIYQQLREKILRGELAAEERLPSSRKLAEESGVGRITVLQAYDLLQAEGFIVTRVGAGSFVARNILQEDNPDITAFSPALTSWGERVLTNRSPRKAGQVRPEIDFGFGHSYPHSFPYDIWRKLLARYLSRDEMMLSRYGSAAGFTPLREALADYLTQWRGVVCTPKQVVIVNGAQQALDILTRLFVNPGDEVLIETPGYRDAVALFQAHGAKIVPIRVDEAGLPVENIPAHCTARMVFVTPANQFPNGGTLSLQRRIQLLDWAQTHQSLIIEDDYDGELRYDGHPRAALQGLDGNGRTVYLGTFSKVLFPALRLAYVVLPSKLVAPFVHAKGLVDRGAPTLTQAAIADFITEGHFERHLKQLRKTYQGHWQVLIRALEEYLGGRVKYTAVPAGLHVMLYLQNGRGEEAFVRQAAQAGIGIYPGAPYHLQNPAPPSVLLGFSGLRKDEIEEGIRRLGKINLATV